MDSLLDSVDNDALETDSRFPVGSGPSTHYQPINPPRLSPASGVLYRVEHQADRDQLEAAIAPRCLKNPLPVRPRLAGYLPFLPSGEDVAPTHLLSNGRVSVLRQATVVRKVPVAARTRAVNAAITAARTELKKPLTDIQEQQISAQAFSDLLKTALTDEREAAIYYDHHTGHVFVGAGSTKAASEAIAVLDSLIKGHACHAYRFTSAVEKVMTHWLLTGVPPEGFEFGQSALLVGASKERAKFDKHDLTSKELIDHLHAGLQVHELELVHQEKVSLTLTNVGLIKGIALLTPELIEDTDGLSSEMLKALQYALTVLPSIEALLTAAGGSARSSRHLDASE